jgi:guanylate cyclase, other
VLKAEYRGTVVAVKRVLPPKVTKQVTKGTAAVSFDGTEESLACKSSEEEPNAGTRSRGAGLRSRRGAKSGVGLKSARGASEKMKKEFVSEMRLLSKLRHPCITTIMGKKSH